jgi:hypothetical protein
MRLTIKMINLPILPPTPLASITKTTNHKPLQPFRFSSSISDVLALPKFLPVAIFINALTFLKQRFSGRVEKWLVEICGTEDCVGACEGGNKRGGIVEIRGYEGDVFWEGLGTGGVGVAG